MILYSALGWSIITISMPFFIQVLSPEVGFYLMLVRFAHGAFQGPYS